MRIAITGASGFLGQALVPLLAEQGHDLLLVGRSVEKLTQHFSDHTLCDYDDLSHHLPGYDALLHLAVMNNDAEGHLADFQAVNVRLFDHVLAACAQADVRQVLLISSLHAETPDKSAYARSKREAEQCLEQWAVRTHSQASVLRLPAVYTSRFAGALSFLNAVPNPLQPLLLKLAACVKPVVGIERVAHAIVSKLNQPKAFEVSFVGDGQGNNWIYASIRRGMDVVAGLSGLVLLSVFLAAVWSVVKLTSKGPGLFVQTRVGRHGHLFQCIKFRTMFRDTPNIASDKVGASAITPQGAFLRRTKLDELPQLWNVLLGQQSLIGPRPCLPSQTELIEARERLGVLRIRPGITGWAQIQGVDMRDPDQLAALDADYIARRTLLLDAKILLATLSGRGSGDAAT